MLPEPLGNALTLKPLRDAIGIDGLVSEVGALSSHPILGEVLPSADRGQAYIEGMAALLVGAQNDPIGTAESMVLSGYRERVADGRPKEAVGYLGGRTGDRTEGDGCSTGILHAEVSVAVTRWALRGQTDGSISAELPAILQE